MSTRLESSVTGWFQHAPCTTRPEAGSAISQTCELTTMMAGAGRSASRPRSSRSKPATPWMSMLTLNSTSTRTAPWRGSCERKQCSK